MSEHTPGPWTLDDFNWRMIIRKPGDGYITRDICRLDSSTMQAFAQRANARLIAEAPEMLKALQLITSANDDQLSHAIEQAKKVINKATGKS